MAHVVGLIRLTNRGLNHGQHHKTIAALVDMFLCE